MYYILILLKMMLREFIEACTNQTINDIDRAGKFLIFKLDDIAFVSTSSYGRKVSLC